MVESDYFAPALSGVVITLAPGTVLDPILAANAGNGVTLQLKPNTFGNPYIYAGSTPGGTYLGGLKLAGPIAPQRTTFSGPCGGATQLTAAQLAGEAAVILLTGGDTANYAAGSAGHGWDGLVLENVVVYGPAQTLNHAFIFDASASITESNVKPVDITGGYIRAALRVDSYNHTGAQSATNSASNDLTGAIGASPWTYTTPAGNPYSYTISGGTISAITVGGVSKGTSLAALAVGPGVAIVVTYSGTPTVYLQQFIVTMGIAAPVSCLLHNPIFDHQGGYLNASGALSFNTGQYEEWKLTGIAQFNPSGLYTADVAVDAELGSALGLRSFEFEVMAFVNMKGMYHSNVGKIRGGTMLQRITRSFGSYPGILPQGGNPFFSSASSTIQTGALDVDILRMITIQEANSSPAVWSPHLFGGNQYLYLGDWHIGYVSAILNGPSFDNGGVSGSIPSVWRLMCAITANANQYFDSFIIDYMEIGFNVAVGSTGINVTSGKALPLFGIGVNTTSAGAVTAGRFRVGHLRGIGASGPTSQTWAPTTATPFSPTYEGTYSVSGAGVTAISIKSASGVVTATGLTAGSWHLQTTDTITVTFTGSPTFTFYQGNLEPTTGGDGSTPLLTAIAKLGVAATTFTLSDEEFGFVDMSEMATAAITAKRPAPLGTWATTRRKISGWAPADAADTVTIGSSAFTYTHGTTNLVTKGLPADGPCQLSILKAGSGTLSSLTYNGATLESVIPAASSGYILNVEVGDVIVVTWATTAPTCQIAGKRVLGS